MGTRGISRQQENSVCENAETKSHCLENVHVQKRNSRHHETEKEKTMQWNGENGSISRENGLRRLSDREREKLGTVGRIA